MSQQWPGQKVTPGAPAPQQQPARPDGGPVVRTIATAPDPNQDARLQMEAERLRLAQNADARAAQTQANTQNLTPAQKAVDNKFANEYVEWAVSGGKSDYEKSRTQLDEVARRLESGAELTGPITGNTPDFVQAFINPDAIASRDAVQEVVQRNLRLILGAQFTKEEGERLIQRSYNPALSEAENAKRLRRLLRQIDQAAAAKDAAAQYYEQNGTLAGWDGRIPTFADIEAGAADGTSADEGAPFIPGAQGGNPSGLLEPEMIGDIPRGSEVELGFDQIGRDEISRGKQYLEDMGIFANDEARITAFWNVNRANPALSVEAVKDWYDSNGYPPPTDEQIAQTIEAAQSGGVFTGIDTADMDAEYIQQLDALIEQRGINPEDIDRSLASGAASGSTLGFNDEIVGAVQGAGALLRGEDAIGAYEANRDVRRRVRERAYEANPITTGAAEIAGSLVVPGTGARNAVARGGQAAVRRAARDGAIVGGVAGAGYGEGAQGSLAGAAIGAPIGAAAGALTERGLRALRLRKARRGRNGGSGGGSGGSAGPSPSNAGREVIEAADSFNAATGASVRPIPADTGGAMTRRATGAVAQTTFGAKPIVEGAQAVNDQARAGIRTLAGRQGDVPGTKQAAGETAIRGADKVMKRSKLRVDAKYAKARKEAGNVELELPLARTTLQGHIDELSRVPGGAEGLATLKSLQADLAAGRKFPVDGIKKMREQLRDKFMKDGLRGSDLERRVNDVVEAADLDIEDGLIALGKQGAARAYADASAAAAERFKLIDDVMMPILGKKGEKSGEQVFAAIDQLTRGDAVKLGQFMRALPDEEAGSIRGIVIDRLGRKSKGRQDADGEAFSLNDFLTRWNDEGLSKEAKRVLFDGETIAALDDLARVAQGTKEGQRFANFSNSGGANAFNALVNGTPLIGFAGGLGTAAMTAGASITAQVSLGRLLGSPSFARWLAKMPKQKTPGAVRAHLMRLDRIAAADSAIAADVLGLQRELLGAFQQGARSVAAEDQTGNADSNTTGSGTQ